MRFEDLACIDERVVRARQSRGIAGKASAHAYESIRPLNGEQQDKEIYLFPNRPNCPTKAPRWLPSTYCLAGQRTGRSWSAASMQLWSHRRTATNDPSHHLSSGIELRIHHFTTSLSSLDPIDLSIMMASKRKRIAWLEGFDGWRALLPHGTSG